MNAEPASTYPATARERDKWILAQRPKRNILDPLKPYQFFVEDEVTAAGDVVPTATIFLTNRGCPWHCLMCDLWRNTLEERAPRGAIATQIDYALERLSPARQIKLYNSGSFFDTQAIPTDEYDEIASKLAGFDRVIVESHPRLVGESCFRFKLRLKGQLEVAMGLETVHPETLARLNKGMTLAQFAAASELLTGHDIDLRVFILVRPPFTSEPDGLVWAKRSLDYAFDHGAKVATLIPTRAGNGALEKLAANGDFAPPELRTLEEAASYGLSLKKGRVFVDLWNLSALAGCPDCSVQRISHLRAMNLQQCAQEVVSCAACE